MPPKGTNAKKIPRSGRLRKMAVNEEVQEEPILAKKAIDDAPKKENGTSKEVEDKPGISGQNVNGKIEELEETAAVPKKRGNIKAKKGKKAIEISSDEITSTEREPEKVVDKKAADDTMADQKNQATAEPEKVSGKRGRKKAVEPVLSNQDQAEESNAKQEATVAGPSKRSRKIQPDTAAVGAEDDVDFAPRKTRGGGRNAKDTTKEVVPAARGRKRKVIDEKAEDKETKKGKVEEDHNTGMQIDDNRQLRVDIERNTELDEMAKNSSMEEQTKDEPKKIKEDLKVNEVKGATSKSGQKRANKTAGDAKPAKAQKEEAGPSKKVVIPDTICYDFDNSSKTRDGKPWNFKIVSWNINGIRAWLEKDGLNYLKLEQPDVMCVQEIKCSKAKLPSELGEIEGYHCHWLAAEQEGYSGVGMFFKKKPIFIQEGIGIEEHDNEGRVLTAEYENFYIVTSYVPNAARGLTRLDYRMKWDNDFRAYVKQLDEKKPVILCGDLNVAHEEIDLANPKSNKKNAGFTKEERGGFSALLKEGFVDTFRHLYPDTKDAYTFWTYMMNARAKNVGWRIDYFVVSERFTDDHLCDNAMRKNVLGSDHCPIVLFLHV